MADEDRRTNLGRGLSALLGEGGADFAPSTDDRKSQSVPIEFLKPGRNQPRKNFSHEQILSLVKSIREKGILQPILVRRNPDASNTYEIIAGERRWRAAQMAQLHEVPIIVKDLDDREALEIAMVENLQRQDLSPLEEAEGYRRLTDEFGHNQEELAANVGKSRSHIANMMRLLGLPDPIKSLLEDGALSVGHARALLNANQPEVLATKIVKRGLNVRQTEKLVRDNVIGQRHRQPSQERNADILDLERSISDSIGLKVEVKSIGEGGKLVLHYNSPEQLDNILQLLKYPIDGGIDTIAGNEINEANSDQGDHHISVLQQKPQ